MTNRTVTADASERPFGIIPMQDAVSALVEAYLDGSPRVRALVSDERRRFRSPDGRLDVPAPLVVAYYDHFEPWRRVTRAERVTPSRRVLFARDGWACQYCGFQATPGNAERELTVDHVKPARLFPSRRAATYYENLTTACRPCNSRKGGHLPRDVRDADGRPMLPRSTPREPHLVQMRFTGRLNEAQRDYVRDYYKLGPDVTF